MTATTPPEEPGTTADASDHGGPAQPPSLRSALPGADQAAVWERVVPGAGDRVLQLVEKDFERETEKHRQWCLDRAHERRMDLANLALRATGMVVGSGGVAGYLWVAKYFVDHGAAIPAAGMLGGGVAALAAAFLGNSKRNPRA
ncbi:hypothetical protein ACH4PU_30360 [Streptomyces sp. NPDC021100]|uniref:hypothetical protein n=1 Tax=Streptomyces sp. NPDC021100 TaxID=3365114 RepID=UPI0037AFA6D0